MWFSCPPPLPGKRSEKASKSARCSATCAAIRGGAVAPNPMTGSPATTSRAGGAYVHDPDGHELEFLATTYTDEFLTTL